MADRKPPVRSRVDCPGCERRIAVTFNKRTGDAYIRSHVSSPGVPCAGSGRTVPSHMRNAYRMGVWITLPAVSTEESA